MNKLISTSLSLLIASGVVSAQVNSAFSPSEIKTNLTLPIDLDVSIYPNPTKLGIVNIAGFVKENENQLLEIQVFNLNGKLVLENTISIQSGIANLDINELKEGEYSIRMNLDKTLFRSSLIVID